MIQEPQRAPEANTTIGVEHRAPEANLEDSKDDEADDETVRGVEHQRAPEANLKGTDCDIVREIREVGGKIWLIAVQRRGRGRVFLPHLVTVLIWEIAFRSFIPVLAILIVVGFLIADYGERASDKKV